MKIGRLLEFHQNNLPELSIPKNLGDGFLINKNHVYRAVRYKAASLGYQYSDNVNTAYLALPLSQLESVLDSKTIPYNDNVSVLHSIEKQLPNATEWDEVTDNLKRNHVFHESCHTIARSASKIFFQDTTDRDSNILRLLIEESFSNTCELLGITDVEDNAHRIFYELNSYIFMYEDKTQLKKLVAEIGQANAIKLLIGCYLFSNFLHEKINEADYGILLKLFNLSNHPATVQKTLRSVSKISFELNPRFRWVTTTFYLKLNGLPVMTNELSAIPFLKMLVNDIRFIKLIDTLSQFDTLKI